MYLLLMIVIGIIPMVIYSVMYEKSIQAKTNAAAAAIEAAEQQHHQNKGLLTFPPTTVLGIGNATASGTDLDSNGNSPSSSLPSSSTGLGSSTSPVSSSKASIYTSKSTNSRPGLIGFETWTHKNR